MPIKPKLKLYLPSKEQSNLEGLDLKNFYKLYIKACSLDWIKIEKANQELVRLFEEYNKIKIIWENTNIEFSIKWMWARNSVIKTNYPGTEVFSAPVKESTNWYITFNNPVYSRYTEDVIDWLRLSFKNWKLILADIINEKYSKRMKTNLLHRLWEKINEKSWNKYIWEIWVWTNFLIPIWIKHNLIWEKALWMHFALWKSYKFPEIDNWNHDTTIHWDIIRCMKDAKVYFEKEGKKILIMNGGKFSSKYLPKLYNYQKNISTQKYL